MYLGMSTKKYEIVYEYHKIIYETDQIMLKNKNYFGYYGGQYIKKRVY